MSDWQTSGYVTQTDYTHGYYPEMNPARARLLFRVAGLEFPTIEAACELGFGQGISVNIHAAASGTPWHGTDFNPAHAAHARALAAACGAPARLEDESFRDFAARTDLPDFDFIALHGVWSWVSPENRRTLVEFIDRRLKPGGVVFASYNMLPGWGPLQSLRQLMLRHAESLDAPARPITERVGSALAFARELKALDPLCWGKDGAAKAALEDFGRQDPRYLAHEYFNRDWHPMHFDEIAGSLAAARLQFACPAQCIDHVPSLNITAEQQAFVAKCPDPVTREMLLDMMLDRKFRRDYWVRGARRIEPRAQRAALRELRFVPIARPGAEKTQLRSPRGEVKFRDGSTTPILEALRERPGPSSIGEIEARCAAASISFDQLVQSLMLQVQVGNVAVAQEDAEIARGRGFARALNARLLDRARFGTESRYLASPVTGGGVPADRLVCLFLLAKFEGADSAEALAGAVWRQLQSLGEKMAQDGRQLESPEENLQHLGALGQDFMDKGLRTFEALGIS